jgi:S-adenosylmethionine:tRNA ribosyltransferase-isomerase
VAAPTAGLHFTPGLLEALRSRGVERAEVTLHVGTGTFKPVEVEVVEEHPMHAEWCGVPAATGAAIDACRAAGGRVFAVGTTSARTLESFSPEELRAGAEKWSRLLITPGFAFRNLDGLMTNFHLPRSTLMAMVASLLDERSGGAGDGVARLKALYAEALSRGYRFYSYGDGMLVLP